MNPELKTAKEIYQVIRKLPVGSKSRISLCDRLFHSALVNQDNESIEYFRSYWFGLVEKWLRHLRPDLSKEYLQEACLRIIYKIIQKSSEGKFQYKTPTALGKFIKDACRYWAIGGSGEYKKVKRGIIAQLKSNIMSNRSKITKYVRFAKNAACSRQYLSSVEDAEIERQLILSTIIGNKISDVAKGLIKNTGWPKEDDSKRLYRMVYNRQQTVLWNFYRFLRNQSNRKGSLESLVKCLLFGTEIKQYEKFTSIHGIEDLLPTDAMSASEISAVRAALSMLTHEERETLILFYVHNTPIKEISELVNSISTVRQAERILANAVEKFEAKYYLQREL